MPPLSPTTYSRSVFLHGPSRCCVQCYEPFALTNWLLIVRRRRRHCACRLPVQLRSLRFSRFPGFGREKLEEHLSQSSLSRWEETSDLEAPCDQVPAH